MKHTSPHFRKRGFTLLELLVAITILGLLTSLGASLLHMGSRSWEKTYTGSENTSAIENVQTLLRHQLERIEPTIRQANGTIRTEFDGRTNSISYVSFLPEALRNDGPAEIRLYTEENPGGKGLVLAWKHGEAQSHWAKSILMPDIDWLRIGYYGPKEKGQTAGWQTSWSFQKTLPQAIKIEVGLKSGALWPTLIVAPMINMDVACGDQASFEKCWAQ
jgi:general secretion pathway protein J